MGEEGWERWEQVEVDIEMMKPIAFIVSSDVDSSMPNWIVRAIHCDRPVFVTASTKTLNEYMNPICAW